MGVGLPSPSMPAAKPPNHDAVSPDQLAKDIQSGNYLSPVREGPPEKPDYEIEYVEDTAIIRNNRAEAKTLLGRVDSVVAGGCQQSKEDVAKTLSREHKREMLNVLHAMTSVGRWVCDFASVFKLGRLACIAGLAAIVMKKRGWPSKMNIATIAALLAGYMWASWRKWIKCFRDRLPKNHPNSKFRAINPPPVNGRRRCPGQQLPKLTGDCFDSQWISFRHFLFGQFFVAPNAIALQIYGLAKMEVRRALVKYNLVTFDMPDYHCACGRLILETSLAKHVQEVETGQASFLFRGSLRHTPDLQEWFAGEDIVAVVDLDRKTLVEAKLGDQSLDAQDAFVLLIGFATVTHVHIHSYANWGVNMEHPNKLMRTMGVVSALFNSYGNMDTWQTRFAVSSKATKYEEGDTMAKRLEYINSAGVVDHDKVVALSKYSRYVAFVLRLRRKFMQLFQKYKCEMEGLHPEGLFQATVMHSLDHEQGCKAVADPLWIQPASNEFEGTALIGRIGRSGFMEELPGLLFETKLRKSSHPFFKELYVEAACINQEICGDTSMADSLETCVVR